MPKKVNVEPKIKLPEYYAQKPNIVFDELRHWAVLFTKLRMLVPFAIIIGATLADWLGFSIGNVGHFVYLALFIFLYNGCFLFIDKKVIKPGEHSSGSEIQTFAWLQIGFDYISMFVLIHFTGGISSPLIFFFIFHIIFASVLMPPLSSYIFSGLIVLGMTLIAIVEYYQWIPNRPLVFEDSVVNLSQQPVHIFVLLLFYAGSLIGTTFLTSSIMTRVKPHYRDLFGVSSQAKNLNNWIELLSSIIKKMIASNDLQAILDTVIDELLVIMEIKGASVKLLSKNKENFTCVASRGLNDLMIKGKELKISESPLNAQVLSGTPYVSGNVDPKTAFMLGDEMQNADIKSILFVPLFVENDVIGVMSAYCSQPDRFTDEDLRFFLLVAGLVASTLDNAFAKERTHTMNREKSVFMLNIAENLRTPLEQISQMRQEMSAELPEKWTTHFGQVTKQLKVIDDLVSDFFALVNHQKQSPKTQYCDLIAILNQYEDTLQQMAAEKSLTVEIDKEASSPKMHVDKEMIIEMLDNLISNAVKYTPEKGKLTIKLTSTSDKQVQLSVSDTGIGIPAEDQENVLLDFYRADNAKAVEAIGSGLGLSIVREIVTHHEGTLHLDSKENEGTTVTVKFPYL